jgi:methylenetetrahydrofolate dehydrogenase (NADP+)/methenyltetrahydrofolate cyclohydrolase
MTAQILDGKAIAARVREEVRGVVAGLVQHGISPGLAVVLVGDDPASQVYVKGKHKAAAEVGVTTFDHKLPADTSQAAVLDLVGQLARDPRVHGILVQLPLPRHIDATLVLDSIPPEKDVDGFHPDNIGRLAQGRPRFVAATPKGCMRLLAESGIAIAGSNAVIVGRSNIVGKPMALLLTNANATTTVCHSKTRDLAAVVAGADIVVAAIGRARFIRGEWIREGAVVIDVGINRTDEGKLVGDVDFVTASQRAGAITPVPGGVGPMTIACLLENVTRAADPAA